MTPTSKPTHVERKVLSKLQQNKQIKKKNKRRRTQQRQQIRSSPEHYDEAKNPKKSRTILAKYGEDIKCYSEEIVQPTTATTTILVPTSN